MLADWHNVMYVIKQNKSELTNIVFKIQQIIKINFICISLFWEALKSLYNVHVSQQRVDLKMKNAI